MSAEPVIWREPVQDAWIDYNGHLSEPYYVLVFGHATDAVMDAVGLGPDYREAHDASHASKSWLARLASPTNPGVKGPRATPARR